MYLSNGRARHRRVSWVVAVAALVSAILGVSAVVGKDQPVRIVDFGFEPATVTVDQGQVVTWMNAAARGHTVTADKGSFDSGTLSTFDSFANVFETAGTFTYHCSIHPTRMKGTVIVKVVVATPTPSGTQPPTPPPGTLPPNFKTPLPSSSPEASATPMPSPLPSGAGGDTSSSSSAPLVVALALIAVIVTVLSSAAWRRQRST